MDIQFFTEEVKAAERSLYRIARSFLPTDADAADAVQEALTRAWAKRHTLREPVYFRTWLTRILINVCKAALKDIRRVHHMTQVPDRPPDIYMAERNTALRDAVQALDIKYRVPLVLFYLDGYSLKEIAGLLVLPQGTIKNRLFRAKEKLRTHLTEEVFGDE